LYSIANRFRTAASRLAAWNGIENPDRIYPGQELIVAPGPKAVHTVKAGDSLWKIAREYGVPMDALIEANGVRNPSLLRIGQQLTIPALATGGGSWEATGPIARPGTR